MSTHTTRALVLFCLLAPLLSVSACAKNDSGSKPVSLDGVISSENHGKGDLVGSLWNCKSSCTCADGLRAPVAYASCAATDLEARNDAATACARACAILGDPSMSASFDNAQCSPANQQCGYPSPIGGPDFGNDVDMSTYDDGYPSYPIDLSSPADFS